MTRKGTKTASSFTRLALPRVGGTSSPHSTFCISMPYARRLSETSVPKEATKASGTRAS